MSVHAEPPPSIVSEPHGINYATSNQLGKGGFAICFKAERLERDQPTGHVVALKIVKSRMEPAKLAQKFITELQIHSKLSHPNIVGFHRAFSFGESTYVVLELCSSGSLADMLKRRKNITMPEIRRFIIQVSGAVKYLHARNIVHRDLKTGNLFLDEKMNIKVGDFGLAALLVSGKDMDAKRRTTMCGTPNYLAPEILEKGKGHSEKVDLWAIGIIAYTLAVGKAPFHASSKEEIYKKLKAGDYSWPELSSITNEISADLRDLVSSLLVSEELRPSPDQIVSHPFFKIAFVPRQMSRAQVSKVPTWPNVQPPSPEVLQRGYSESWWYVCKESGVGEYAPGKCFQLNAGKKIRSIVRDIEREVAAGRQPVIPIPSDTVYTSPNSNSIDAFQPMNALPEIAEEREPDTRQLKEICHNEVQPTSRENSADETKRKKKDAELMPPPPRVRRAGPIRRTRVITDDKEESAPESTRQSSRLNTLSQTNILSQTAFSGTNFLPSSSQPQSGEIIPVSKRSVDASLARRPRKNLSDRDIPALADAIRDDLEIAPSKTLATRTSRSRSKQPSQEVVEIFDEQENLGRPALPPPPTMTAKLPVLRRKPLETTSTFPGSDPTAVLERLNAFRDNLASALERKHLAPSRRVPQQPSKPLPFVSRWVDYSKKHGVGYVLDDGTVGCVINGSAASGTPVTHVAVKNGERWLARIGKRFEHLEHVPFRIFEDHGAAGLEKLDLTTRDEKMRERLRMLRVLWVKFGRYMSQTLNATETADCADDEMDVDSDLLFVRFYQRSGNVGIWGFSDGCVQLHFPDHTKFVLSADGLHTSATLVPVEGVRAIEEKHDLPTKLLRDRQTLVHSIHALLYGSQPGGRGRKLFADMVQANMVEEKLYLLLQILDQWISGGGLGCTGVGEERLQWQGSWVNEHARKIDWVTVGRLGGDEVRS